LKRFVAISFFVALLACTPPQKAPDRLATLMPSGTLSATEIMQKAHEAAGGETWSRPKSLSMSGYGVFYKNGKATRHETHNMWRVYAAGKTDAHKVDGKVRIESIRGGKAVIDLSYDGKFTYTPGGQQPQSESDKRWSSNFGFGVIRHALDDGYALARMPDDLIDGRPAYMVEVTDPVGGTTQFGFAQDDFAILKVAFDTPRGWHERIYSNFFSNTGEAWVQPGRVRLYYGGVKANEVIWESYSINDELPECLFRLPEADDCRG